MILSTSQRCVFAICKKGIHFKWDYFKAAAVDWIASHREVAWCFLCLGTITVRLLRSLTCICFLISPVLITPGHQKMEHPPPWNESGLIPSNLQLVWYLSLVEIILCVKSAKPLRINVFFFFIRQVEHPVMEMMKMTKMKHTFLFLCLPLESGYIRLISFPSLFWLILTFWRSLLTCR